MYYVVQQSPPPGLPRGAQVRKISGRLDPSAESFVGEHAIANGDEAVLGALLARIFSTHAGLFPREVRAKEVEVLRGTLSATQVQWQRVRGLFEARRHQHHSPQAAALRLRF